nr:M1 family aminopeptidase [Angustibacter aerolatus]
MNRKEQGYVADAAPTTHPIRRPVPDVDAAKASFDMVTYAKGASVLKQAAALVGEEAFVGGLRTYFAEHLWSNATLDDLLDHVGRAAGRDLTGWAEDWLLTSGTDVLTSEPGDDGLTVRQSAPSEYPTLRTHRVDVGVYDLADGALRQRERVEAVVEGAEHRVPVTGGPADLLLVNDHDLGFVRVRLDERSLRTATAVGFTLPDPVSRSVLRLVLWQQVEDGVAPPADVVRYALRAVAAEPEPTVQDALLRTAVEGSVWWTGAGRDEPAARGGHHLPRPAARRRRRRPGGAHQPAAGGGAHGGPRPGARGRLAGGRRARPALAAADPCRRRRCVRRRGRRRGRAGDRRAARGRPRPGRRLASHRGARGPADRRGEGGGVGGAGRAPRGAAARAPRRGAGVLDAGAGRAGARLPAALPRPAARVGLARHAAVDGAGARAVPAGGGRRRLPRPRVDGRRRGRRVAHRVDRGARRGRPAAAHAARPRPLTRRSRRAVSVRLRGWDGRAAAWRRGGRAG